MIYCGTKRMPSGLLEQKMAMRASLRASTLRMRSCNYLGSELVGHNQKMTFAAM
jgi:hypothetical protein